MPRMDLFDLGKKAAFDWGPVALQHLLIVALSLGCSREPRANSPHPPSGEISHQKPSDSLITVAALEKALASQSSSSH